MTFANATGGASTRNADDMSGRIAYAIR